jgi:hypothetical protein
LNKNQLHIVAVLLEELGFLGHPKRRELANLAGPNDIDVGGERGGRLRQYDSERYQAQCVTYHSHAILLVSLTVKANRA